jgi:hypothetical protein
MRSEEELRNVERGMQEERGTMNGGKPNAGRGMNPVHSFPFQGRIGEEDNSAFRIPQSEFDSRRWADV